MICPACKTSELATRMTKLGIMVDMCPSCQGIWLDKGEIFSFSRTPKQLAVELQKALANAATDKKISPKSGKPMQVFKLFAGTPQQLILDFCSATEGIWCDGGELKKLTQVGKNTLNVSVGINPDNRLQTPLAANFRPAQRLLQLPNLFLRSFYTIFGLYAMLGALLIAAVEFAQLDLAVALIIAVIFAALQFILGPWLMDLSLRFLYRIEWLETNKLPEHLRNFLEKVCREQQIKLPRMGLIHDGAPNAFTYGHTPNNARIVFTQGILNLLTAEEVEAVVAHEIGHAKHWDMLLMTIVQLVPMILYYIYRSLSNTRKFSRKGRGQAAMIAIVAYILYFVSQYLVLWFSRTREYFADRFSGQVTRNPNFLASALVKIAYGLAGMKQPGPASNKPEDDRSPMLNAVSAMGIFDIKAAHAVAINSYHGVAAGGKDGSGIDKKNVAGAMKWDLWNPWAKYYELHSTHPLVANRLRYLGNQAEMMRIEPYIRFDERKPESYWDEFVVEIFVMWLPALLPLLFVWPLAQHKSMGWLGMAVIASGVGGLIKLFFSYRADNFPAMNVASLLNHVKVSAIRPVPCTIKGTIIGRGVPGLIWSEDFVMQDESGIMFLDYRQPFRIWEFFFGLLRAADLQNQSATVVGWFRRAPIPYIEIKSMRSNGELRNCYVYWMKLLGWILLCIFGIVICFGSQIALLQ